jgi:hypothetical protein
LLFLLSCPSIRSVVATQNDEARVKRGPTLRQERLLKEDLQDDSFVFLLEPGHGISLGHSVALTNFGWFAFATSNTVTGSDEDDVEIHTKNTGGRVILQTKINVLVDTESKATSISKVLLLQFVFLDLKSTIQDFLGFESSDLK